MGRRIVCISPAFLRELVTQSHTIGDGSMIRTVEGVPADATLLRCWMDHDAYPDGEFVMLFEHSGWSKTAEGAQYEVLDVKFQLERVQVDAEWPMGGRVWADGR